VTVARFEFTTVHYYNYCSYKMVTSNNNWRYCHVVYVVTTLLLLLTFLLHILE